MYNNAQISILDSHCPGSKQAVRTGDACNASNANKPLISQPPPFKKHKINKSKDTKDHNYI